MEERCLEANLFSGGTPNPWKAVILLEELALPYEIVELPMNKLPTPVLEKINPDGLVLATNDPNTGITLWEVSLLQEVVVEDTGLMAAERCHHRISHRHVRHRSYALLH